MQYIPKFVSLVLVLLVIVIAGCSSPSVQKVVDDDGWIWKQGGSDWYKSPCTDPCSTPAPAVVRSAPAPCVPTPVYVKPNPCPPAPIVNGLGWVGEKLQPVNDAACAATKWTRKQLGACADGSCGVPR